MIYTREESEYHRAKMKAARRICRGEIMPGDLPSNREIRHQIEALARLHEGQRRTEDLRQMRVAALRMMFLLRAFRPRLIGSALTGNVRPGCDIDLYVCSESVEAVAAALEAEGVAHDIQRKRVRKQGTEQTYDSIVAWDRFPFELTVYPANLDHCVFKSSVTGRPIEQASIAELEQLLARQYPDLPLPQAVVEEQARVDRFEVYEALLLPLETVKEDPALHPEGDVLYHSLQVFELARNQRPYDEEFLLAALLHDVGKGIDPKDHVAAALEALEGFITPRTAWLIEHHTRAHSLREGTLGVRSRRRLEASEDFEELMLLARCDSRGRAVGMDVPDVDEALAYLRELAESCGE